MSKAAFRPTSQEDLEAVIGLLADDFLGAQRDSITPENLETYRAALAEIQSDPNNEHYVADIDGEVVGCLQLTFIPGLSYKGGLRGQIESVRVRSDLRGQGIGRQFFEWAIERCRKKGCYMVQLTAHNERAKAHNFYFSLGFVDSHAGMKLKL